MSALAALWQPKRLPNPHYFPERRACGGFDLT
jgi:hypothetical protein